GTSAEGSRTEVVVQPEQGTRADGPPGPQTVDRSPKTTPVVGLQSSVGGDDRLPASDSRHSVFGLRSSLSGDARCPAPDFRRGRQGWLTVALTKTHAPWPVAWSR